jgi:CheY-like chemotaxis protein
MGEGTWQVIIVEDEFDSMQMVSAILRYHHIDILVAHNGIECLELLKTHHATMVLTDLSMPEMDGWQTLNAIRSDPRLEHLPVVAITAYYSKAVSERAMAAGFNAFFAKPISPRTFVQELSKLIVTSP